MLATFSLFTAAWGQIIANIFNSGPMFVYLFYHVVDHVLCWLLLEPFELLSFVFSVEAMTFVCHWIRYSSTQACMVIRELFVCSSLFVHVFDDLLTWPTTILTTMQIMLTLLFTFFSCFLFHHYYLPYK